MKDEEIWDILFRDIILEEYYVQKRWFQPTKQMPKSYFESWNLSMNGESYTVQLNWNEIEGNSWSVRHNINNMPQVWGKERRILKKFIIAQRKNMTWSPV